MDPKSKVFATVAAKFHRPDDLVVSQTESTKDNSEIICVIITTKLLDVP